MKPPSAKSANGRPLAYAARSSIGRRGVMRLCIAVAFIVAAIGSPRLLRSVWLRARQLYWQRLCMSYVPSTSTTTMAGSSPALPATPWEQLSVLIGSGGRFGQTLYVHERTSPGGHRRLVVVVDFGQPRSFGTWPGRPGHLEDCYASVIRPGSLKVAPAEVPVVNGNGFAVWVQPRDTFLLGPIDLSDPSHLQIHCCRQGQPAVVIDGWLTDSDTVVFSTTEIPPATLTPAPRLETRPRTAAP